jgi:pyruvate dehydrogenase E2 component (dihydrolipoamide acetyltransferase)
VELPSPFAGTVTALMVEQGATVEVGRPIISINTGGSGPAPADPATEAATTTESAPAAVPADEKVAVLVGYGPTEAPASRRRRPVGGGRGFERPDANGTTPPAPEHRKPLAAPPVRLMARQLGIDLADVPGTGHAGVITREDVTNHVATAPAAGTATAARPAPTAAPTPLPTTERETRAPIHGVRKHTAQAMVRSAFTAPHVTEFVTVDVTPTMELVERLRESPVFEGVRLTPLTLVAKALLMACRSNPSLNSSWDEERQEIVTKHYVNLGIAAATPRGLLVPNVKDAHTLSLRDLAQSLNDLTLTAREGRSTPADLSAGTITITNIGVFGIDAGTPILNPGEAAILCFGSVRRQPWEFQGEIALRQVTTLSLSFDHRLVDGQEGSLFLAEIARILADPTLLIALS